MTPDEMRVAIAEKCGWGACQFRASIKDTAWLSGINPRPDIVVSRFRADGMPMELSHTNGFETLPDYPDSLDACHEMEKVLTPEQRIAYATTLCSFGQTPDILGATFATAAQRAAAFSRLMWPEKFNLPTDTNEDFSSADNEEGAK